MDYAETAAKLSSITESLETGILRFVNPTNAEEEKRKFFSELESGRIYNPTFNYIPRNPLLYYFTISADYEKIVKEIRAIETDDSIIGKLFEKKKKLILMKIELIKHIGGPDFTSQSIGFYGKPEKELTKEALEILPARVTKNKKEISPENAKSFLQKEIDKKNLGFEVLISNSLSAMASVSPHERKLFLRNMLFSEGDIQRFNIHEIQTHIYRFVNGISQPIGIFGSEVSNNFAATEEGLAAKNEEIFGVLDNRLLKIYAGRVVALDFALEHSFSETFQYLSDFFDQETAYVLTQRVKRGLTKTENPGAFTKDYIYLKGKGMIDNFVEQGNSLEDLYYGKISLEELDLIKQLEMMKKPLLVPDYRTKKIGPAIL